jgi:hypothetical protein
MRCPACNGNIRPQGRFCPLCGTQIFGAGGVLVPPAGPPAPPVLPRITPAAAPAGANYTGKTCPFCQFVIKPGDSVVACPHCEIPHHADCWMENAGCTTFGCAGANSVAPAGAVSSQMGVRPLGPGGAAIPYRPMSPGSYGPPVPPPGAAPRSYADIGVSPPVAKLRNQASWSLGLGIFSLFCCMAFVVPIFGLVLGIKALKGYNGLRIASDPGRGQAVAGIVCSSVGLIAGLVVVIVELIGSH